MDFESLKALAYTLMGKRKSHLEREVGAIYDHGVRVSHLSLQLRERIFPGDSSYDDVLRCAGLFHDLGKGIGEHGHTGALLARDALSGMLTPSQLDTVCSLIEAHNKRRPEDSSCSPAVCLLQDADLLDHFGSYEVWLNTLYCAHAGQRFHEALDFYETQWPADILRCSAQLNYPLSKEIFEEKAAFSNAYAARLKKESRGEIYGF